jgi:hypothetical protein
MPRLTDPLRSALGNWWDLIYGYATQGLSSSAAVKQANIFLKAEGTSLSFQDNQSIATLYGYARRIVNAGNSLTSALPSKSIDSSMIADAPWARAESEQATYPIYNVKFTYVYKDQAGNIISTTKTSVFNDGLPGTVGDLIADVLDDAEAMAAKYGHELLSATPFEIQAV